MTINDILQTTITESVSEIGVEEILLTVGISMVLGFYIYFVYKKTFQGVIYSRTFNMTLPVLSIISSGIILGVTFNIVLSLGMVGALSIIRFRTAIKDPMDVVYMFWAIATGILSGAGLYQISGFICVVVGIVLFAFSKINTYSKPYLLIIDYVNSKTEKEIYKILNESISCYDIKSKVKNDINFELTVELKKGNDHMEIVNYIDEIENVSNVSMVSYDGEYTV